MTTSHDDTITVVCAADNRYAMPLAVVIRSAMENLSSERQIVFFVIDGGIKPKNKDRILRSIDTENSHRCQLEWVQPPSGLLNNMKVSRYITTAAYLRLLIPSLLPAHFSKAIYLDSDLIVRGDLSKLWDIDLADNYLLAVQSVSVPCVSSLYGLANYRELRIPAHYKYFNSGVMVINLEQWRTNKIGATVIEYLEQNKNYVTWHDQDGLNAVLAGQWGELEPRWNQTPRFRNRSWQDSPFSQIDFDNAKNHPYIIHFASSKKPWNSRKQFPGKDLFFQYLDKTAWSGWKFNLLRRIQLKLRHKSEQLQRRGLLPNFIANL